MPAVLTDRKDRVRSAALAALINLAIGYGIVTGLGVPVVPAAQDALKLFTLSDQPPPPPPVVPPPPEPSQRETRKPKDPEGAAAPPAKRNTPTEIAAPKARLPPPPPIQAALVPGKSSAAKAGAATIEGAGTGRNGIGDGLGSGLSGSGTGGGGGGGIARGPVQIAGGIGDEDYPTSALIARQQGLVRFAFTVMPDGHIADCRVRRSSGSRALDATTCRLALQRFRFRPARDTAGRPLASAGDGEQYWQLGREQVIDEPAGG
ncbi:MAG: energy transducer TonB [Sphingomicrobium sp.]